MTEWYGKGYEEACKTYDFKKNFEKCGSALTCDASFYIRKIGRDANFDQLEYYRSPNPNLSLLGYSLALHSDSTSGRV